MRRRNFIAAALASAFASSLSRRRDPPGDRSRDGSRASHDTQIRSRRELPRTRCAPTEREPADPHLAHIESRMAEGCENTMALWREVRDQGFAGRHRQVHRFVAERRTAPARRTARKWLGRDTTPHLGPSTLSLLPSPKQLAWLLVQHPDLAALVGEAKAA